MVRRREMVVLVAKVIQIRRKPVSGSIGWFKKPLVAKNLTAEPRGPSHSSRCTSAVLVW